MPRTPRHLKLVTASAPVNAPELPSRLADSVLASIIGSSQDSIKLLELDGSLCYINPNGCNAMEIDDFSGVEGAKWHELWPESAQGVVLNAVTAAVEGRSSRFEAYGPTAKGAPRWWEVSVSPVTDAAGKPTAILSVSRDVTERVHQMNRIKLHELELQNLVLEQAQALRDKQTDLDANSVIMREIDHRMKNSLAMVSSLLRMEGRKTESDEARQTISAAAGRVASIAAVHEQLFLNAAGSASSQGGQVLDMGDYLPSLCRDLGNSLDVDHVAIEVNSESVVLPSADAVTVGMVVSELVMNAVRHGAVDANCTVRVGLSTLDDGRKELFVGDDGCGLPDGFAPELSKGLGMRVVTTSAAKLNGTLTFETGNAAGGGSSSGALFKLVF
ncbi:PAS domain-containing protein [Rhizobiaceae bacterium]|nr:PAS domain-containing protein [Rhizobiaceae bacterium]